MAGKLKFDLHTGVAFLIWTLLITGAFVFTGFKEAAQFAAYATWLTIGLGTYTGKRLIQKKKEFNNQA